jgi:hypothetical protein
METTMEKTMGSTIATRERLLAMARVLEAARDLEAAMTEGDPLRGPTRALMDQLGARLVTELELDPSRPYAPEDLLRMARERAEEH